MRRRYTCFLAVAALAASLCLVGYYHKVLVAKHDKLRESCLRIAGELVSSSAGNAHAVWFYSVSMHHLGVRVAREVVAVASSSAERQLLAASRLVKLALGEHSRLARALRAASLLFHELNQAILTDSMDALAHVSDHVEEYKQVSKLLSEVGHVLLRGSDRSSGGLEELAERLEDLCTKLTDYLAAIARSDT